MIREGIAWCFGDAIGVDSISPLRFMLDPRGRGEHCLEAVDPAFAAASKEGDLLVAGDYGYMGPYIAKQFFPHGSDLAGIMATFMVFAVAFFMRPIGAVVFGRLTDKVGRRPMLATIISVMSLATAAIGILPTTRTIGDAAPALLVLCRIIQGFSGGGEMGGAVSLTVENAPPGKRGLYGSWSFVGTQIGFVCGGAVATLLSVIYTPAEMGEFGWRIPFLIALPLGGVALYIRLKIDETPHFKRVQAAREASPGRTVLAPSTIKYTLGYLVTTVGVLLVLNAVGNTFLNGGFIPAG